MAILKFVPAPKNIRDNRSNPNGYYIATCNACGIEFFPKRSNAMYCTPKCAGDAHRSKIAIPKEKTSIPKEDTLLVKLAKEMEAIPPAPEKHPKVIAKEFDLITDRSQVIGSIAKRGKKTRGLQAALERLKVAQSLTWEGIEIKRVTRCKYEVEQ